jgi:hypothetical protein
LVLGFWVTGPRSSRMCLTPAKPKRGGSVGVIRGSHERFQGPACEQFKTIEKRSHKMILTKGRQGGELGFLRSGYAPVTPADLR